MVDDDEQLQSDDSLTGNRLVGTELTRFATTGIGLGRGECGRGRLLDFDLRVGICDVVCLFYSYFRLHN